MLNLSTEKADIINAFAVGARNLVGPAIVPRFVDALGVNHKKAIAVGQLVELSIGQSEHAAIGAAAAMYHKKQRSFGRRAGF